MSLDFAPDRDLRARALGRWATEAGGLANERVIHVEAAELPEVATVIATELGGWLTTMVGTDERAREGCYKLRYVFSLDATDEFLTVEVPLVGEHPEFASITPTLPSAHWYEREVKDLLGLEPVGHPDPRRLVLHEGWPKGLYPLRKDFDTRNPPPIVDRDHPFRPVVGEGIVDIPVGPIHAGIIEPGHFRFGAIGEVVLRLDAQLFYTHRGIEKQVEGMPAERALFVAERTCGACAYSHATSYCQALEALAGVAIPPRAAGLRAIYLELERLYNHIGDVGNICAGTSYSPGSYHGGRIKETVQQLIEEVVGNRFLRGANTIGGLRRDVGAGALNAIERTLNLVERDFQDLCNLLLDHDMFVERLIGTGILKTDVARALGAVGVAARASGIARDARRIHPHAAYRGRGFDVPTYPNGDVRARVRVRVDEAFASIDLIRQILADLPGGPISMPIGPLPVYRTAFGLTESPRGENVHWVMTGPDGTIERLRIRSASFCNWPVVPYTAPGNMVPDFPLINKSFELCYACLDR